MFVRILRGRDFLLRLGSRVYVAVVFLIILKLEIWYPEAEGGTVVRKPRGAR